MTWQWMLAAYGAYLVSTALLTGRTTRVILAGALVASAGTALALARTWGPPLPLAVEWWLPALILVGAYRVSGLFFVRAQADLERRLLESDRRWLNGSRGIASFGALPRWLLETLEVAYLLAYPVVPAAAAVLVWGGRGALLSDYWSVVFGASLACYGALPWVQTRPPRTLEDLDPFGVSSPLMRRVNLAVLGHGSIQVNTIPSGHVATSLAVSLFLIEHLPAAGVFFLAIAIGIAVATVVGRYHYLADSVLGMAVALVVWAGLR